MGNTVLPGKQLQIPSAMFNFLTVVNKSSYNLDLEAMHNNIGNPAIIITDANKDATGVKEQLKNLEGQGT